MDTVALVSVTSSGLVALAGIWVSYRSGRDQRKHETLLAYEERAWERKTDALFEVIRLARALVDIINSPLIHVKESVAVVGPRTRTKLDALVPVVEAYASSDCRIAFDALRSELAAIYGDPMVEWKVERARDAKLAAIDAQDFDAAIAQKNAERKVVHDAYTQIGINIVDLRKAAEKVIDTARASVRGDT